MLTELPRFLLPVCFALLVTCALTTLVSLLVLLLFKRRHLNRVMRHPYLHKLAWEALPWRIRATILLDYFLRLAFARKTAWVFGDANRLLAHIVPADIPSTLKWPLYGLWGGCAVGLLAMMAVWLLLLILPT